MDKENKKLIASNKKAYHDFFVDESGRVIFNEINTIPGFTPISMYPKLMMDAGLTYPELIDRLIDASL